MNQHKRRKLLHGYLTNKTHIKQCVYCRNHMKEICEDKKLETNCYINNVISGIIPIPSDTTSKYYTKRTKIRRLAYPAVTFYFDRYIREKYESFFLINRKEECIKTEIILLISDLCYISGLKLPSSYEEIHNIIKEDIRTEYIQISKVLAGLRYDWSEWINVRYGSHLHRKNCICTGFLGQSINEFVSGKRIPIIKSKVYSQDVSESCNVSSTRHGLKVFTMSRYDAVKDEYINGGLIERFYAPIIGQQLKLVHGFTKLYVFPSHPYLGGTTHCYNFIYNLWKDTYDDISEIISYKSHIPINVSNIISSYSIGDQNDIPFLENVIILHHDNRSSKLAKLLIKHKIYESGYSKNIKLETYPNINISRIFEKSYKNRLNILSFKSSFQDIHCACKEDILGLLLTSKLRRLYYLDDMMTSYVSHWAFFSELIVDFSNDDKNIKMIQFINKLN